MIRPTRFPWGRQQIPPHGFDCLPRVGYIQLLLSTLLSCLKLALHKHLYHSSAYYWIKLMITCSQGFSSQLQWWALWSCLTIQLKVGGEERQTERGRERERDRVLFGSRALTQWRHDRQRCRGCWSRQWSREPASLDLSGSRLPPENNSGIIPCASLHNVSMDECGGWGG